MPSTPGMKGEGYYDRHSGAQSAAIGQVADWLRQAAQTVPLPPAPRAIAVLDLGSSEGRNAVGSMRIAIEALRGRTRSRFRRFTATCPATTSTSCSATSPWRGPWRPRCMQARRRDPSMDR